MLSVHCCSPHILLDGLMQGVSPVGGCRMGVYSSVRPHPNTSLMIPFVALRFTPSSGLKSGSDHSRWQQTPGVDVHLCRRTLRKPTMKISIGIYTARRKVQWDFANLPTIYTSRLRSFADFAPSTTHVHIRLLRPGSAAEYRDHRTRSDGGAGMDDRARERAHRALSHHSFPRELRQGELT